MFGSGEVLGTVLLILSWAFTSAESTQSQNVSEEGMEQRLKGEFSVSIAWPQTHTHLCDETRVSYTAGYLSTES